MTHYIREYQLKMKQITPILLLMLFHISSMAMATETKAITNIKMIDKIQFQMNDGFSISADYYAGSEGAAGVLLLHGCESSSQEYFTLGNALSAQGIHALAINLRGFGASSTAKFSQKNIKQKSDSIASYKEGMGTLTAYWNTDLLAAYQLLRMKIGMTQKIALITSGCTSSYAAKLANQVKVSALVMLEPEMTLVDKESFKRLFDIPSYFIDIENKPISYQTSKELFAWNGDENSKLQVLKKTSENIPSSRQLSEDIARWLRQLLK